MRLNNYAPTDSVRNLTDDRRRLRDRKCFKTWECYCVELDLKRCCLDDPSVDAKRFLKREANDGFTIGGWPRVGPNRDAAVTVGSPAARRCYSSLLQFTVTVNMRIVIQCVTASPDPTFPCCFLGVLTFSKLRESFMPLTIINHGTSGACRTR
jgi:hypothetical protein